MSETEDIYLKGHDEASGVFHSVVDSLNQVRESVEHNAQPLTELNNALSLFSTLGREAYEAVVAIPEKLFSMAEKAGELGHEFELMSQRTGMTVEQISALRGVATRTGTSIEALQSSFRFLSKAMVEIDGPGGQALAALGISAKDADGKMRPLLDVMEQVADHFKDMEAGAEKNRLGAELLGRSYQELIPFLNKGGEAIRTNMENAAALGKAWSEVDVKIGADFNLAMKRMQGDASTFSERTGLALAAIFQWVPEGSAQLMELFLRATAASRKFFDSHLGHAEEGEKAEHKMAGAVKEVADAFDLLSKKEQEEYEKVAKNEADLAQKRFQQHQEWLIDIAAEAEKVKELAWKESEEFQKAADATDKYEMNKRRQMADGVVKLQEEEEKQKLKIKEFYLDLGLALQADRIAKSGTMEEKAQVEKLAVLTAANDAYFLKYGDQYTRLNDRVHEWGAVERDAAARQQIYVREAVAGFRQWATSVDAANHAEQSMFDTADHLWDAEIDQINANQVAMRARRLEIQATTDALEAQYQEQQKLAGESFTNTIAAAAQPGGGGYNIDGFTSPNFVPLAPVVPGFQRLDTWSRAHPQGPAATQTSASGSMAAVVGQAEQSSVAAQPQTATIVVPLHLDGKMIAQVVAKASLRGLPTSR